MIRNILIHDKGYAALVTLCSIMIMILSGYPANAQSVTNTAAQYRLGIFPYLSPRQTVELYGPMANEMGKALSRSVKLESLPSFTEFTHAMSKKKYDIALIQPFDYTEVVEKYGYIPLARLASPLVTQIFVRDDSRFTNIEDLRGTTVAMPPAQSANARMGQRALIDNNLVPGQGVQVRYFNSHDSCIQQVWIGKASSCVTARPVIAIFENRMHAKLRPIYDSPALPHILFVAHPRVSETDRNKLAQLLIHMQDSEDGRAKLKSLGFPGFVACQAGDYDVMRNYTKTATSKAQQSKLGTSLTLGVFPYFAPRQLASNVAPALPSLTKAAKMPVYLRSAVNFGSFLDNVAAGRYDIILIQPFDYAKATQADYLPLAAMKEKLQGEFFVLENSAFKTPGDFKGKVVALPPAESAQARLGYSALLRAGLQPGNNVKIDYRINHDSCLRQVQRQEAVACVTSPLALKMLPEKITAGLRGIGKTEAIPGVIFMSHKRVPDKIREQIGSEIIHWHDNDDGVKILRTMGFGDFGPVNLKEYRDMPHIEVPR